MDLLVVVSAQLLFLLQTPTSDWLFDIPIAILATDHEADLTRRISWNCGVCILDGWENL
jgi:hypothetical protein